MFSQELFCRMLLSQPNTFSVDDLILLWTNKPIKRGTVVLNRDGWECLITDVVDDKATWTAISSGVQTVYTATRDLRPIPLPSSAYDAIVWYRHKLPNIFNHNEAEMALKCAGGHIAVASRYLSTGQYTPPEWKGETVLHNGKEFIVTDVMSSGELVLTNNQTVHPLSVAWACL